MNKPLHLTAIAAMDRNRVIGHAGKMPWHYPEDLRFFKNTTMKHPVIMGRKTFESIGKPLPGRHNVVLSATMAERDDVTVVPSMGDAICALLDAEQAFVIGGAKVYEQALPYCSTVLITLIPGRHDGDTFMPVFEGDFTLESEDESTEHSLRFRTYQRRPLFIADATDYPTVGVSRAKFLTALTSKDAFAALLNEAAKFFVDTFAFFPDTFTFSYSDTEAYVENVDSAAVSALMGMVCSPVPDSEAGSHQMYVWHQGSTYGAEFALRRPKAARPSWYTDPTAAQNLCQRPTGGSLKKLASRDVKVMTPTTWKDVLLTAMTTFGVIKCGDIYPRGRDTFSLPRQWAECLLNVVTRSAEASEKFAELFNGQLDPLELPGMLWGESVSWDAPELNIELWRQV